MGDPAGIGPEICLRLLAATAVQDICVPIVFGDAGVLRRVARQCGLSEPRRVIERDQWPSCWQDVQQPSVLNLNAIPPEKVTAGRVDSGTGLASYRYIEQSIEAALAGQVDAVATGPVNKEALHDAGIPYPGHTEIFAAKTEAPRACMMLTCDQLTCSFVTTHVGYRDVPGLLNESRVLEVIELSHEALSRLRGRPATMVVCGLNPHAGEHGLFGDREEERIIVPAIEAARRMGLDVQGPLPPDTAFLPERRRHTDCFVCMYHDQGHIPLKALAFDVAVNVTLGLPIIRTSVDHGTALDIAWQAKADVTSLTQAVLLAAQLATK
jgi:4-hydroxythreonine-4-phosphate dehydrogenase